MSSTESNATPALPTSPTTRADGRCRSHGGSPGRTQPTGPSARPRGSRGRERVRLFPVAGSPPYCRIVHRRFVYIVARGPRANSSRPGTPPTVSSASRSAAVYSGLTAMSSGVCRTRACRGPRRASRCLPMRARPPVVGQVRCSCSRHTPLLGAATILAVHRRSRTRAVFELRQFTNRAARSGTERCVVSVGALVADVHTFGRRASERRARRLE